MDIDSYKTLHTKKCLEEIFGQKFSGMTKAKIVKKYANWSEEDLENFNKALKLKGATIMCTDYIRKYFIHLPNRRRHLLPRRRKISHIAYSLLGMNIRIPRNPKVSVLCDLERNQIPSVTWFKKYRTFMKQNSKDMSVLVLYTFTGNYYMNGLRKIPIQELTESFIDDFPYFNSWYEFWEKHNHLITKEHLSIFNEIKNYLSESPNAFITAKNTKIHKLVTKLIRYWISVFEKLLDLVPPLDKDIIVFRGMAENTSEYKNPRFLSTSLYGGVSAVFTKRDNVKFTGMINKIKIPSGTKCLTNNVNLEYVGQIEFIFHATIKKSSDPYMIPLSNKDGEIFWFPCRDTKFKSR